MNETNTDPHLPTVTCPIDWAEADRIATERRRLGEHGATVEQVHREATQAELLKRITTPQDADIEAARGRLDRERAALDQLENARLALVGEWESLLTKRDNILKELRYGASQWEVLDQGAGRLEYLRAQFGNEFAQANSVSTLIHLGSQIHGLRLAREEFQKWKAQKEAELAQARDAVAVFDHLHGISAEHAEAV